MTAAPVPLPPPAAGQSAIREATIRVRGLKVAAEIGVHAHEHGRRQPLTVDVEIRIDPPGAAGFEHIADTFDYEIVAETVEAVAAAGHLKLVETFAERVARRLIEDGRVRHVRVRVDKPGALPPAVAGVEIALERT